MELAIHFSIVDSPALGGGVEIDGRAVASCRSSGGRGLADSFKHALRSKGNS